MRKDCFLYRAYDLYADGFRHMRLGKTLWAIILIKLFIIFVVGFNSANIVNLVELTKLLLKIFAISMEMSIFATDKR